MVLRYAEYKGTPANNAINGYTGTIFFGLQGDDTFNHPLNGQFLVYAGGSGSDTYNMGYNPGLMTIAETSGADDRVIAYGIGVNRASTYFATIESRHLVVFDTASGQGVLQLDWTNPAHRIEHVTIAEGTFSYDQIVSFMGVSPHYLGDFTWSSAVSTGALVLPPGAAPSDVNEAITYYKNLSIALEAPAFAWTNIDTSQTFSSAASTYTGPVNYLDLQFLGSNRREAVVGTAFSDFVNGLGGDDAISTGLGDDVLDGGTGSNFLTGGTGHDVFFLDGRGGTTTWATITDWEAGEELSVWGWRPGVSKATWVNSAGAAGWTGVTFHGDLNGDGTIDTSVTWTGLTRAQLPTPLEFDGLLWFK